jgi:hypothetical protein
MDQAKADAILAAMREGKSLRKAAKEQDSSPGTFLHWVEQDDERVEQYAQARARMLDVQAEELEAIGEAAAKAKSATRVAGLRLQSDNRKWLLSKLAPRKYGEKIGIGGAEDLPPLQTEATLDVGSLTPEQLRAIASIPVKAR